MKNANRFASGRSPRYRAVCSELAPPTPYKPLEIGEPPSATLLAAPTSSSVNYLLIYLYVHDVPREIYGTGRRPIFVSLGRSASSPVPSSRDRLKPRCFVLYIYIHVYVALSLWKKNRSRNEIISWMRYNRGYKLFLSDATLLLILGTGISYSWIRRFSVANGWNNLITIFNIIICISW